MKQYGSKENNRLKSNLALEKVGELIKQAREEKNFTTKEIAESLKIGEEQLIALENGRADLLPEMVFIKGMIKRVSERIHIDSDSLIKELSLLNVGSGEQIKENVSTKLMQFRRIGKNQYLIFAISFASIVSIFSIRACQYFQNDSDSMYKLIDQNELNNNSFN